MPETTPSPSSFDDSYVAGTPPWVIGEPQPAVVDLVRHGSLPRPDGPSAPVLDVGCGAGEHTILLTELGHDALGVDAAPAAIALATANAARRGVPARFAVADVLAPGALPAAATVLDSALFHVFAPGDRAAYADALSRVVVPGGRVVVLALAVEGGSGFGPEVSEDAVPSAFTEPHWALESQQPAVYRGRVVTDAHQAALSRPVGALVDLPAWLAVVRRL